MTQQWTLADAVEPSPALVEEVGGHPLIARLLAQRGHQTVDEARRFLDPSHYTPSPPTSLYGLTDAVQTLQLALEQKENILIWGDFDVDGQTSTSLLVSALQKLAGAEHIFYHVPNRFEEGHGILPEFLRSKLESIGAPIHLLITCDTGIDEGEAIGFAKDQGLRVIVTDHHDLTPEFQSRLPRLDELWGQSAEEAGAGSVRRADAIVNPKFQPEGDPLRTLPGVGVAYKLIQQLYSVTGHAGEAIELLDLVALGIVADVAEQINDARYLLQLGLEQLRVTKRVGLLALMEVSGIEPDKVDAEAIGFQIGPRMNALGRLEDATVAVELLTTSDPMRARQLAAKMNRLNQQRRRLTTETAAAAANMVERDPSLLNHNGLVLAHPAWHAGIVGIVASQLAEKYGKPTVLLLMPPGLPARGSARSVDGVDIGAAIAACSDLLHGHGGHPGAAGLSLPAENIDRFRRELSRQIEVHRRDDAPTGLILDADVPLEMLTLELADDLQRLAPFGQGNPEPKLMSRQLSVVENRRIGQDGAHRRLTVQSRSGASCNVIWFRAGDAAIPEGQIDLAFTLGINVFRGERKIQLMYLDIRGAEVDVGEGDNGLKAKTSVIDLRTSQDDLADLPAPGEATWYAEGVHLPVDAGAADAAHPRLHLRQEVADAAPGAPLVIWNAPPESSLLQWMLEKLAPSRLYLCNQPATDDGAASILQAVAGMCKHARAHDQPLDSARMAARLGTTTGVIDLALRWLEAKGLIGLTVDSSAPSTVFTLAAGTETPNQELMDGLFRQLEAQLAEIRAFRRFYARAQLSELGLE